MRRLTADRLEATTHPKLLGGGTRAPGGAADAPSVREDPALAQQKLAFEAARKQGHAEGIANAQAEIKAQVEKIAVRLREEHAAAVQRLHLEQDGFRKLAASLQAALKHYASDAETLSVEVAFAAVARLLGEKSADRSLMGALCQRIVQEFGHPSATLRVSEADLASLEKVELGIPVEADRRLSPGQCVIDTARGQFESGLDVRLDLLRIAILSTVAEHRARP
jgi:flagellar biosynthesis/type III secretory pathway protein FliH